MAGLCETVCLGSMGITAVSIAAFGCMAFSPLRNIFCLSQVGERILLVNDSGSTFDAVLFHLFGCEKFFSAIGAS